jgi:ubiquinone/menaquinone biosynthesis C-methylase UbiE
MGKLKFLHIGCGPKRKDSTTKVFNSNSWEEVTLDIDKGVNPDILGTMTDLSMIEDSSFDAIYSSHNIEHLFLYDALVAVKEFYRILKSTGYILVVCPDIISTCEAIVEKGPLEPLYYIKNKKTGETSKDLWVSGIDILYGWRRAINAENNFMAHKFGYSEESLRLLFSQNKFKSIASVTRKSRYDINLLAFKEIVERDTATSILKDHLS